MKKTSSWLVTATCLALPLAAVAQANSAGPAPGGPALRYESAFADYKSWQASKPGDWRSLNDALVKQPAAHGAHGAAPGGGTSPAPAATPADSQQAPVPDHGAHHMHGGQK